MTDPRYTKLARLLIGYSTALKKGDRVLLDMFDVPDEFAIELMRAARAIGAFPLIEVRHTRINREIVERALRGQRVSTELRGQARDDSRSARHKSHAAPTDGAKETSTFDAHELEPLGLLLEHPHLFARVEKRGLIGLLTNDDVPAP